MKNMIILVLGICIGLCLNRIIQEAKAGVVQQWAQYFSARETASIALVALDQFNVQRKWIQDFKGVVATSTTLAQLKTGVAGLPDQPPISTNTLTTALAAKYVELKDEFAEMESPW